MNGFVNVNSRVIMILIIGIVFSRFVMMNILICSIGVILGWCVVFFKNFLFNIVKLIVVLIVYRLIIIVIVIVEKFNIVFI